jgi:glycosyltransferase involved in cell wall biosynthesis
MPSPIPAAVIAKEARELELADAVFCPSPMVARSLRAVGIPESKLLPTSYGWEPRRFAGTDRALEPVDGPTFLFVGYVCVRKGAHLLLEAWQRAGRPGRLVLVGNLEPLIARRYASVLAEPSVRYLPFTPDVGAIFRAADWFVFPSLEEGGPQVTYEAAGCGVPGIVSEMGAGAFTRDGEDGVIVRANDVDSWADALVRLGPDRDLQQRLGASARAHAADFTWERVGARRAAALLERFG